MAGKKKIIKICMSSVSAFLAAVILTMSSAYAFDVNENSQEQQKLTEENSKYQEELKATEKEIKEKEEYSKKLQQQISDLTKQIQNSNAKIKKLNSEINEKQKQIDDRLEAIEDRLDQLRTRLRAIYAAGDISTLEIILQAKDFSDFIDKMEIVQSIASYDDKLINGLKSEMDGIGKEQEKLRDDKAAVEEEKKQLEANKTKINALSAENQELILELNAQKQDTEAAIKENEQRQNELQKALEEYNKELAEKVKQQRLLQQLREQQRKEREEQRKKQQEEAAKANQDSNSSETKTTDDDDDDDDEPYIDTNGAYVWPCPGHTYLTSTFDEWRGANNHGALDIADGSIYGASVVACWYGTVISTNSSCPHDYGKSYSCGCGGGYGNYVMIDHGDGKVSIYGHLSGVVATPGQEVLPGQLIGYVGSTGYSTGPHLHFEMQYYGVRYDPLEEYL